MIYIYIISVGLIASGHLGSLAPQLPEGEMERFRLRPEQAASAVVFGALGGAPRRESPRKQQGESGAFNKTNIDVI